jgi:hypothetical protein
MECAQRTARMPRCFRESAFPRHFDSTISHWPFPSSLDHGSILNLPIRLQFIRYFTPFRDWIVHCIAPGVPQTSGADVLCHGTHTGEMSPLLKRHRSIPTIQCLSLILLVRLVNCPQQSLPFPSVLCSISPLVQATTGGQEAKKAIHPYTHSPRPEYPE